MVLVLLILLVLVAYTGLFHPRRSKSTFTIIPVERGTISSSLLINGVVANKEEVSLHSAVAAEVLALAVEEGQRVHRGQLLARLDEREAQLSVRRAQATLTHLLHRQDKAELDRDRLRALHEVGGEAGKAVEDADLQWQSLGKEVQLAHIEKRRAELQLERCRITAPSDAIVIAAHARVGAQLRPGDALFRLAPLNAQEIEARIDAADSAVLMKGKTVLIFSDAHPGQKWLGKMTWIAPAASRDGSLNQMVFRIRMDSDSAPLVLGQQVEVRLEMLSQEHALKLPSTAIFSQDGKRYVAMLAQGRVRFKEVVTGIEDSGYSEILTGLRDGDRVLMLQGQSLREGDSVQVLPEGEAK